MTVVTRRIDEHVIPGRRLGRHVEHDPRSREYPAARGASSSFRRVMWKRHLPAFDQSKPIDLGSCTGNAAAGALDTEPLHKPRARLIREAGAVTIYAHATALDDIPGAYPPDDTGSTGLAAAKACVRLGLAGGYTHAFGIDHALAALQNGPVITGVDWYEGFDHPNADGLVVIAGQIRGGHEFEVVGYDPASSLVYAYNSWGTDWGDAGRFCFSASTWAQLLDAQGDVTVLLQKAAK